MRSWSEIAREILRAHNAEAMAVVYRGAVGVALYDPWSERGPRQSVRVDVDESMLQAATEPSRWLGLNRVAPILVALAVERSKASRSCSWSKRFIVTTALKVEEYRRTRRALHEFSLKVSVDLGPDPRDGAQLVFDADRLDALDDRALMGVRCWISDEEAPEDYLQVIPSADGPAMIQPSGLLAAQILGDPKASLQKGLVEARELESEVKERHGDELDRIRADKTMSEQKKVAEARRLFDHVRDDLRATTGCLEDGKVSAYSQACGEKIVVEIQPPIRQIPGDMDPDSMDFSGARESFSDACKLIVAVMERAARTNADEAVFTMEEIADILRAEDVDRWRRRVDRAIDFGQKLVFKIESERGASVSFPGWSVMRQAHVVAFQDLLRMSTALRFFVDPKRAADDGYRTLPTSQLSLILAPYSDAVGGMVRYMLTQVRPGGRIVGGEAPGWAPPLERGRSFAPALGMNRQHWKRGFQLGSVAERGLVFPMPTGKRRKDRDTRRAILEILREVERVLGGEFWLKKPRGEEWLGRVGDVRDISASMRIYPFVRDEPGDHLREHHRRSRGQVITTDEDLAASALEAASRSGRLPSLAQAKLSLGALPSDTERPVKVARRVAQGLPIPVEQAKALEVEGKSQEQAREERIDRVAEAVRVVLSRTEMSQADAAEEMGISKAALSGLLRGRRAGAKVLAKVESWLG